MPVDIEVGAVISDLENEYQRSQKFLADLCRSLHRPETRASYLVSQLTSSTFTAETTTAGDATNVDTDSHLLPTHVTDGDCLLHSPRGSVSVPQAHALCHSPAPRRSLDAKPAIVRFDAPQTPATSTGLAARVSRKLLNIFRLSSSAGSGGEAPSSSDGQPQAAQAGATATSGGARPQSPAPTSAAPAIVPPALAQFVTTVPHAALNGHHRRSSLELKPVSAAAHRRRSLDAVLSGHGVAPGNAPNGPDAHRGQLSLRRSSLEVSASGGTVTCAGSAAPAPPRRPSNLSNRRASVAGYSLPPVAPQSPQTQQHHHHHEQPSAPPVTLPAHIQQSRLYSSHSLRLQLESQQGPQQGGLEAAAGPATACEESPWEEASVVAWRALRSSLEGGPQAVGTCHSEPASAEHLPSLPHSHSTVLAASGHGAGRAGRRAGRRTSSGSGEPPSISGSASAAREAQSGSTEPPCPRTAGRFCSRVATLGQQPQPQAASPLASAASAGCLLSPSGGAGASRQRRASATSESAGCLAPRPPCGATAATGAIAGALSSPGTAGVAPISLRVGGVNAGGAAAGIDDGGHLEPRSPSAPLPPLPPMSPRCASGSGHVWRGGVLSAKPSLDAKECGAAVGRVPSGRLQPPPAAAP